MTFRYCVVGNGPVGAAVAHEVAPRGDVCVVGARYGDGGAWFSGHEDDTRIVRRYHADPYWEALTERNAPALAALEASTGTTVLRPAPVLYRFPSPSVPPHPHVRRRSCAVRGVGADFAHEDAHGGILDPRRYVAALNAAATASGASVRPGVVRAIRRRGEGFELEVGEEVVSARYVVDARGCHQPDLPDGSTVVGKLHVYASSDHGVDADPYCFVDGTPGDARFRDVYGICDGLRAKLGFSEATPVRLAPREVAAWFRGGFRRHPDLPRFLRLVRERFAGHRVVDVRPCAFVTTPTGRPRISFRDGILSVVGCNGLAAKCCQALAAEAVEALEARAVRS
jgi:glycine/D-amino acid oxidase-like deaminating enzyme